MLQKIIDVVKDASKLMDRENLQVHVKTVISDFVTSADVAVQEYLQKHLLEVLPGAGFVGEENDTVDVDNEYTFIVDPIDGTSNFVRDLGLSCISVGLLHYGKPYIGVIYNPYLNEMYWAGRGIGAFCNETPIRVSSQPLSRGLVLFGTSPYNRRLAPETFRLAYACYMQALDIRRSGSAALDLCAIAVGRAELYIELTLSPWDYAAGSLLIAEAGGRITTLEGEPLRFDKPCSVLACNGVAALPGGFSCS
ncbi:MAG: inositol monophosphatase [Oscillospiraceae bacterium]|nr:inositol monophosphatase [Oscillospiraceae bacterium]